MHIFAHRGLVVEIQIHLTAKQLPFAPLPRSTKLSGCFETHGWAKPAGRQTTAARMGDSPRFTPRQRGKDPAVRGPLGGHGDPKKVCFVSG